MRRKLGWVIGSIIAVLAVAAVVIPTVTRFTDAGTEGAQSPARLRGLT